MRQKLHIAKLDSLDILATNFSRLVIDILIQYMGDGGILRRSACFFRGGGGGGSLIFSVIFPLRTGVIAIAQVIIHLIRIVL